MPNRQPHKLFYKGKDTDFVIFVEDPDLLAKYRKNDTTIPLIDLVSIFKIFTNRSAGANGVLDEASKSELSNEFGSSQVDSAIKAILLHGSDKQGAGMAKAFNSKNDSMGGGASGN
ncbi:ribosome maturation protein [Scheffersomyces coipomensis]|uniref:ribosome maturation protein n=1 Tax=Scheffersomyces coipomensis TaxID=1788519 RepID=UPI00315D5339